MVEQFIHHERDINFRGICADIDKLLNRHPLDKEYQESKALQHEWKLQNYYSDRMIGDIASTDEFLEAAHLQLLRLGG